MGFQESDPLTFLYRISFEHTATAFSKYILPTKLTARGAVLSSTRRSGLLLHTSLPMFPKSKERQKRV